MTYWILTVALIVFGFIGSFTIGLPILLLGLTMLVLGPFRRRQLVFWPPMLGVVAAVVVFMAVAPFSCVGTLDGSGLGGTTTTVCTSLLGIRYEMQGLDNPSLQPPILTGLGAGIVTALLSFAVLRRRA